MQKILMKLKIKIKLITKIEMCYKINQKINHNLLILKYSHRAILKINSNNQKNILENKLKKNIKIIWKKYNNIS